MLNYIIRRLLISIVVLALVTVISFGIVTLAPGSPSMFADMNPKISESVKEIYRKKFHFDQPLHRQFWFMMRDLAKGDLVSAKDERPVLKKIAERVPATLLLNVTSMAFVFAFGIPLGVFAARSAGRWPDTFTTFIAFLFIALPGFWISYMLCIWLVKSVGVPLLGIHTFGVAYDGVAQEILDRIWHLVLPAFVLGVGGVAVQSRFIRASMIETLGEDYIRTARAKGLPPSVVFYKHALRNSIRPLITSLGYLLPALLGGSVIIETIFAYPGMGRLGYEAVLERDYPVIITLNFVAAILVLLGNLVADLLYPVVDPRVRLQ